MPRNQVPRDGHHNAAIEIWYDHTKQLNKLVELRKIRRTARCFIYQRLESENVDERDNSVFKLNHLRPCVGAVDTGRIPRIPKVAYIGDRSHRTVRYSRVRSVVRGASFS